MIRLPQDFKEFLQLLNSNGVEYLVVGGYAVGYHGYPRATVDLDVWIAVHRDNAERLVQTLKAFGFDLPELSEGLFLEPDKVTRLGDPPLRIELLTNLSGVDFEECYAARDTVTIDQVPVSFIGLEHLKLNKEAAARFKDLNDLEHLP